MQPIDIKLFLPLYIDMPSNRILFFINMYSLIFFNAQGGACQFLIDNDKVDHYI